MELNTLKNDPICMYHSLLVLPVISTIFSVIAVLICSYKLFYYLIILSSIFSSVLGVLSSLSLQPSLFLWFIIIDFIDISLKIYSIVDIILLHKEIRYNCAHFIQTRCTFGDHWSLLLLDLSSSMTFCVLSAIINCILLFIGVSLLIYIKRCIASLLNPRESVYGTFNNLSDSMETNFSFSIKI